MADILLVTGSRALADTPNAALWAWDQLRSAVQAADLVVTGDAPGPDTWAAELCRLHRRSYRLFCLDGQVRSAASGTIPSVVRAWHPDAAAGRRRYGRRWPLLRNEEMLRLTARELDEGNAVRVLALCAGWSRTHGTEHTARLAERVGFPVTRMVCPAELGPSLVGAP